MHRRQVCLLWEISCLSLLKMAVGMRWRDSRSITLWKASARLWRMRCQKGKSLEAWKESRRMGKIEIWRSKTRVHLVWERWNLRKSNLCRSRGRRQTVLRRCLRAYRCLFLSFKRSKLRLFRTKQKRKLMDFWRFKLWKFKFKRKAIWMAIKKFMKKIMKRHACKQMKWLRPIFKQLLLSLCYRLSLLFETCIMRRLPPCCHLGTTVSWPCTLIRTASYQVYRSQPLNSRHQQCRQRLRHTPPSNRLYRSQSQPSPLKQSKRRTSASQPLQITQLRLP